MSQAPSLKRKVIFALITAVLVVGFLEILLQAFYFLNAGDFLFRRQVLPIYRIDKIRGHGLQPNLEYRHATNEFDYMIFSNAQGYRTSSDRPFYDYEKDPDTYRVIAMGPSFAFGWASDYEDIYATLIGERLRVPGKKVEVINVGTPAQGMIAQSCWLEKEGYKFQPDLVLMTSYGSIVPPVASGCPEGGVGPAIVVDGALYGKQPNLAAHLRLFFKNFALVFYGFYAYTALVPDDEGAYVEAGKELYSDEERVAADDDRLIGSYLGFQELVTNKVGPGRGLVFVHIPMSFMVHPNDVKRWAGLVDLGGRGLLGFREDTQRQIAALRAAGIEIVDTTPALSQRGENERMFYWLDIHLTKAGNETVTDAVMPTLQDTTDSRYE
jgi:hypothetical protein